MGVKTTLLCPVIWGRKNNVDDITEGRAPFRNALTWIHAMQAGLCFALMLLMAPVLFAGTVNLTPGSNVPSIVQSYPSGTTFKFAAGVYRLSKPIVPKDHDVFIGATGLGTILRGSVVLSSFSQQGSYWVASLRDVYSNPVCNTAGCSCDTAYPACNLSEDLFFDNAVRQRVLALSQVTTGKWYWDLSAGKVYLKDNPVGHAVEVSVIAAGFSGDANGVTINGLVVERFAGQAIFARIQGGAWSNDWIIENSKIRFGHLAGITMGDSMQILNNTICDNGKLGISGGGQSGLVQGNEICRNNYAGFLGNRGGAKIDNATSLVVRDNYVHDNRGAGFHTDSGSMNTLYEYNHTAGNQGPGIDHEVSHAAIIRYNLVENDAHDPRGTSLAHGAGIWIYASDNVNVYGNTVTNSMNGIGVYQTMRNDNLGTHYVSNLSVHDNSITQSSGIAAGILSNTDSHYYPMIFTSWNNHFDNNTYCLSNTSGNFYDWNLASIAKAAWQSTSKQDVHSVWTCPAPPTNTTASTVEPGLDGHTVGGSALQVKLSNTGSATANNVAINQIEAKTTAGTGTVGTLSPVLPIALDDIFAGGSAFLSLSFNVPSAVARFTLTEIGRLESDAGSETAFSTTQYKSGA